MSDPLIIQCPVPRSADPDAQRRPNLPVTAGQLIEEATAAWRAGPSAHVLRAGRAGA